MSRRTTVGWVGVVMLFLMFVLIVSNLRMSFEVRRQLDSLAEQRLGKTCLPLPSIPLRLIHEDPACAQRVLEAMNVTNVRVLGNAAQLPGVLP